MARTFDLDDDNPVVIVGSGAGGGTLGNELAQRGVQTLILEAGPRIERQEHVDDERRAFEQFTWLDKRSVSGSWGVTENSPDFPAFVCKVVGGTTVHWSAVSLRFQTHEFLTKDVYGNVPGANLLNWPLTLAELEPYYDQAERKMGVSGTHGIPPHEAINNQMSWPLEPERLVTRNVPPATWLSTLARVMAAQLQVTTVFAFREFAPMQNGPR